MRRPNEDRPAPPIVRYAPLGELNVYEISEAELERFEKGPPGQNHLSFALALLPASLTILITLQTVDFKADRVYYAYWIAFWLLLVQGLVSLTQWWTTAESLRALARRIRSRMPDKSPASEVGAGNAPKLNPQLR